MEGKKKGEGRRQKGEGRGGDRKRGGEGRRRRRRRRRRRPGSIQRQRRRHQTVPRRRRCRRSRFRWIKRVLVADTRRPSTERRGRNGRKLGIRIRLEGFTDSSRSPRRDVPSPQRDDVIGIQRSIRRCVNGEICCCGSVVVARRLTVVVVKVLGGTGQPRCLLSFFETEA